MAEFRKITKLSTNFLNNNFFQLLLFSDWALNAYKIFDPARSNGTIDIPFPFRYANKKVFIISLLRKILK